jgi:FkbM family methyltransferase
LTVAYLGNFRHSFCTEVHVAASLEILGHKVVRLQEDETAWATIPATVEAKGAQLFMWTRTWPSEKSEALPVLEALRKLGVPSAFFHLDRWHGLDREHQVHDQPFAYCDVIFSPNDSPKWREDGFNHFWLPPGVYGPECEPVPPNPRRWPYDVVFVGSHPYPHPEWAKYRSDLLSAFSRAFRGRFGILPRRGTPIRGRDLQELYATVPVVLGDSCLAGASTRYWSDRVPETLGRGGLLIHPMVDGMTPWYRSTGDSGHTDFMGYRLGQFDEAVALAKWALQERDVAEAIAVQGSATVLARDTYAHRMGTVLAVAEGIHGGYRDSPLPLGSVDSQVWERSSSEVERFAGVSFSAERIDTLHGPRPRYSVQLHRWSAVFEPRPGTTDSEVIGEVWGSNDYRVPKEGFSGTVVDIGANVGAFSVLAAKAGASKVLAFEPESANLNRLVHHMDLNRVAHRIVAYGEAVSGHGLPVMTVDTGGGARVEPASGPWDDTVQSLTLAALLDGFGPVEFLKMDIEGGEYEAFDACPVEAFANVDLIALEFHSPKMGAHLAYLGTDEEHLARWYRLVEKLADTGRLEIFGHPTRGGMMWWSRY